MLYFGIPFDQLLIYRPKSNV